MSKLQGGKVFTWFVLLLVIGFWVWFFSYATKETLPARFKQAYQQVFASKIAIAKDKVEKIRVELNAPSSQDQCGTTFPEHGSKFKFIPNESDAKLHARLHANNEHIYAVLIIFYKLETEQAFGAVFLHPNKFTQINLPVGNYRLAIQSGEEWCNWHKGFVSGVGINATQQIEIKNSQVTHLRLMSFGRSPADAMLSIKTSLGEISDVGGNGVEGSGSLDLQRYRGHYEVEGTINQFPVYFMVDTGATDVAVPESFAKHAGINACKPSKRNTANGTVEVCEATASELTIGQFKLRNVKISYNKGMSNDTFLLGMNVIGQFRMEQHGDILRLSAQ
ncbi:MAG: retropepsin-like aspartic protease [Methylotenera sp.]